MGHIFISYSHKDSTYVHKLREKLITEGFEVWIDDRIDYGEEWPMVIQEHLDTCDAFILVATESSYKSKWVQKEVTRAQRTNKPFFPLLLSGDPWLSIESTQYVNVRDNSIPPSKFYQRLARVTPRKKISSISSDIKKRSVNKQLSKLAVNETGKRDSRITQDLPENKKNDTGSTYITKETNKQIPNLKIIALLNPIKARIKKIDKRVVVTGIAIALILMFFLGKQMSQNYSSLKMEKATDQAQVAQQEATIRSALTQTASVYLTTTRTPTKDLFATPTITPVIAEATYILTATPNPATATVGAAFTQIALASKTIYPTYTPNPLTPSTTPTPTPTNTFVPSNAVLVLDRNFLCLEGPGNDFNTVTALVTGIKLPIYGRNESNDWWLVQVQRANLENDYCWINGGSIEGDPTSIKIVKP